MRIEDIAREAGVSIATVSRVLNNPDIVKPETRDRVLAVIKARDYVPDSIARGLMTRRSRTIGVLVVGIANTYYMEITQELQRRLREAGLMMLLGATDDDPGLERRLLLDFASRRVDGIVAIDPTHENLAAGLFAREAARQPLVLVHSDETMQPPFPAPSGQPAAGPGAVFIDQRLGMRRAMEHLWELGHRDIAFLRGRRGLSYDVKESAWADWLRGHGQEPRPELVLRVEEGNTVEALPLAEEAVAAALRAGLGMSAIFACNDLQARGAVTALAKAGLRVPGDLSLMSHDNTILATSGRVQFSSIDLRMRETAAAAALILIGALHGSPPGSARVEPILVRRDSTARRSQERQSGA